MSWIDVDVFKELRAQGVSEPIALKRAGEAYVRRTGFADPWDDIKRSVRQIKYMMAIVGILIIITISMLI